MASGIAKSLDQIAWELKGIKNVLASIWESRYKNQDTDGLNPEAYADEYISIEECSKRLNVAEQTVRNWIAVGKKDPTKGWSEGLHYVNVSPEDNKKAAVRIPWNQLVRGFSKNKNIESSDLHKRPMYQPRHNNLNNGSPF